MDCKRYIFFVLFVATACAGGQTNVPPPLAPAPVPPVAPTAPIPEPPAVEEQKRRVPPGDSVKVWRLKDGKLPGQPMARIIRRAMDPKSKAMFTETCWNFGEFAVVESKVASEVGAAETAIRYNDQTKVAKLCSEDFSGRSANLDISEAFFAGVADGFLVSYGAEVVDGLREFRIFAVSSGKQIYKSEHGPGEDFVLTEKRKGIVSLDFSPKVKVNCELAVEGSSCWRKVLLLNQVLKPTPMPDCKKAFAKSKTQETEPALVTIAAHIANLASPTVELVGGHATCAPEP